VGPQSDGRASIHRFGAACRMAWRRLVFGYTRAIHRARGRRPVFAGANQWTAGGDALCTIARWMVDWGDPARTREFIQWLTVGDVLQTEHVLIITALKTMEREGGELSPGRLEAAFAPEILAGPLKSIWAVIVEARSDGAADDVEFEELMANLKRLRVIREQEAMEAKRNAVRIARMVLARTMSAMDGAKELVSAVNDYAGDDRPSLAVLVRLEAAADKYPVGPVRRYWAAYVLAQQERERIQIESDARPETEAACRLLIDRWGSV